MREMNIINLFHEGASGTQIDWDQLDDCSPLPEGGGRLVTTDSMAEGVHFRLDWSSPEALAIKLFQVNLSDMASSGGSPQWCLLNIGIPKDMANDPDGEKFLERLAVMLKQECRRCECPLIGGDTFRADTLILSLCMGGQAKRYISRTGGQAGDHLYLTGDLGLSLAGLRHLRGELSLDEEIEGQALERHLQPQARLKWARHLWAIAEVHAMTDISDGLLSNASQLAKANNLRLSVNLDAIPMTENLSDIFTPEQAILSGEELELLFLAAPGLSFPFPCRPIGDAEQTKEGEAGVRLFKVEQDVSFPLGQFEHF